MNTQVKIVYKMKELNLYRIWQIVNRLTEEERKHHSEDLYVYFLGDNSNYCGMGFESFINHYAFKIEDEYITVFNDDKIPYEDYTNQDFIYVPREIINLSDEDLEAWLQKGTEKELKRIERDKIAEKERIKADIDRLNKQLEKYD